MPNWSLVCFTLFTQSAIGLVWVSVIGHWFGAGVRADFTLRPLLIALILTGVGLCAALAHLARPRLAPHALRNLAVSWLSREVVLVQTFAGAVVLSIVLMLLNASIWLAILEAAACLLGAAVLFAMARVYLLRTVPVWYSPATPLEFTGSAMLLGGVLGAVLMVPGATLQSGWNLTHIAAGVVIMIGLMLKLAAISPALTAEKASRAQAWYETTDQSFSASWTLAIRIGLNICGVLLILIALNGAVPAWVWSCLSLVCIGTAEIIGRRRFYKAYQRLGL
jgi:anaerobic dimethyl sulfoxide reductase subunit C (anchor subunit)